MVIEKWGYEEPEFCFHKDILVLAYWVTGIGCRVLIRVYPFVGMILPIWWLLSSVAMVLNWPLFHVITAWLLSHWRVMRLLWWNYHSWFWFHCSVWVIVCLVVYSVTNNWFYIPELNETKTKFNFPRLTTRWSYYLFELDFGQPILQPYQQEYGVLSLSGIGKLSFSSTLI